MRQLKLEARNYEEGMRETREIDERRATDLDKQETAVAGRERRLIQDRADFEQRVKRYKQLRKMQ